MLDRRRLQKLNLLLLDMDKEYRSLVIGELRRLGVATIYGVGNAPDAIEILVTYRVDAIVTDLDLDFVRLVRRDDKSPNPKIPIVIVTDRTQKKDILAARDTGIHEFVAKPVSAKDLCTHILHAIDTPRPFVATDAYMGPDRRRHRRAPYAGRERRATNAAADPEQPTS